MTTYRVEWEELSRHSRDLTAEEFAEIRGVSVDALSDPEMDLTEGLENSLAQLDDDGFEFLTRDEIEVWTIE